MKYTDKLILNGVEYQFAEGQSGWQPGANTKVYYNINDNDTNSTIYDLSGNGVDQTWYGTPSYATDATYGRVATFNNSYTKSSSVINFGNEVTYICLIKLTSSANPQAIVSQNASTDSWLNGIARLSDIIYFSFSGTLDANRVGLQNDITINDWVMICGTRDSNGLAKIYLNGVYNNQYTTVSPPDYSVNEPLQIGRLRDADTRYFNGQFKLFIGEDRCWTDAEIAALAQEYGFTVN